MNPITLETLTPELREFLIKESMYIRQVDFASPHAHAFAQELYERGKRDALYPGGNQDAACLAFEARLAQFHAAVWEAAADEDGSTAYDEAGVDIAKLLCRSFRSMAASYGEALSERIRKTKRIVDMQREHTRIDTALDSTNVLLAAACKEREELRAELTKERELIKNIEMLATDDGALVYSDAPGFISDIRDLLAHQSAPAAKVCEHEWVQGACHGCGMTDTEYETSPAAKCSRCEASTVENCDEKGCGYLGAGNGAPADTGVHCTAHVDYAPETKVNCEPCKGKGEVFCHDMEDGWYEKCNKCGGTGKQAEDAK